jgi:hypothetical protein
VLSGRLGNQPVRDRLIPPPSQADSIQLRALTAQIRSRVHARWRLGAGISVVDVGCRDRPYEPLFAGRAASYVGVDVVDGEKVDVVAPGDALPFSDELALNVMAWRADAATRRLYPALPRLPR